MKVSFGATRPILLQDRGYGDEFEGQIALQVTIKWW
jgi:hypothetical protein